MRGEKPSDTLIKEPAKENILGGAGQSLGGFRAVLTVRSQSGHSQVTVRSTVRSQSGHVFCGHIAIFH